MFQDRSHAAQALARELAHYRRRRDAVILAIPRGGLAIGAVLAEELDLPLDIVLTKKIGHPLDSEYAIGVVNLRAEIIDAEVVARDHIPQKYITEQVARIRENLKRRYEGYRGAQPEIDLHGKTVIVCDDGIATGNTMAAATRLARREGAKKIVAAVPVAPPGRMSALREFVDETVCLLEPEDFLAIGPYYRSFEQVTDEEAIRLLGDANRIRAWS